MFRAFRVVPAVVAGAIRLAASAAIFTGVSVAAADAPWLVLHAPRFTVVSQLGEKATRAWAEEFHHFGEALDGIVRPDERMLPPLTVVMFADHRDFTPYKPNRPDGTRATDTAGFFASRDTWSVIGLAGGAVDQELRRIIFHEGVHWFTSARQVRLPLWFDEGFAEVFSTFELRDGEARWGQSIPEHVALLTQQKRMPLERLLHVGRNDPVFNSSHRTGIFYAQSWAFVHFLLFGKRDGASTALRSYLDDLVAGKHPDDAFRAALGRDYGEIDAQLAKYLSGGRYVVKAKRVKPSAAAMNVNPAPPWLVEAALARLALGAERLELARAHANRAVLYAPERAVGYEIQSFVAAAGAGDEADLSPSEFAVQLGSQDAWIHVMLGAHLTRKQQARGGIRPSEARRIADLYAKAIELRPMFLDAYKNLAGVAGVLDPVQPADVALLREGVRRFPADGAILLGLAIAVERTGDRAEAERLLTSLLDEVGGLSWDARNNALQLREDWLYTDYVARIEAALKARDFEQAVVLLDELMPKVSNLSRRSFLLGQRRLMTTEAKFEAAYRAMREGRLEEARTLFAHMLEAGDFPPGTEHGVREALSRIERQLEANGPAH